jgi:hypothetical protein
MIRLAAVQRAIAGVALALGASASCMLVSPLEDYVPRETGGTGNAEAGAGGSAVGEGGGAGQGIAGAPTDCQSNQECVERNAGAPSLCRSSDAQCVLLRSEDCPLALEGGSETIDDAIVIGSFAPLDPAAPQDGSVVWAQQLALEELSGDAVGGLPGPGGARRPLVMVTCTNQDGEGIERGLSHLIDTLEVPAVLAMLKPGDLRRAFEDHRDRDVFFLSPEGASGEVVRLEDGGLVWNVLGQPKDLVPAYVSLLELVERRHKQPPDDGSALRVAMVSTTEAYDRELHDEVVPELRFNELSVAQNDAAGDYLGVILDTNEPDIDAAVLQIVEFGPDVVVSTAGESFTKSGGIVQRIEEEWGSATRPMYVLSPVNAGLLAPLIEMFESFIKSEADPVPEQRVVGITVAGPEDLRLQNQYAVRLRSRFPAANAASGNYYDVVYLLAYAMYAAGDSLSGSNIATALPRLLQGEPFDIGPAGISEAFELLSDDSASMALHGTLGAPNFDLAKGVRHDQGAVFCLARDGTSLRPRWDVLRYDPQVPGLVGAFPCFSGLDP